MSYWFVLALVNTVSVALNCWNHQAIGAPIAIIALILSIVYMRIIHEESHG
jgi:hypothetical protein